MVTIMAGTKEYLLVSILTILVSTIFGNVEISFTKGVSRLNTSTYCDYYIACHAEGQTLQWKINDNNVSEYFGQSNVGQVFNGSILNCNYITTLLSLRSPSLGQSIFGSVLILSCPISVNFLNFEVVCTNGSISKMTSNIVKELVLVSENHTSTVFAEHLLSENLVPSDISSCTNIFLCGVDNSFITWEVAVNDLLAFSTFDNVGLERRRTQDTSVKQQAILIGKTPYRLVAALIVVGSAVINVTCGYQQTNANLISMQCSENFDTTELQTLGTTKETVGENGMNIAVILGIIFGGVFAIFFVIFLIAIMIVLIVLYKRKTSKSLPVNRSIELTSDLNEVDGMHSGYKEKPSMDNNFHGIKEAKEKESNTNYEKFFEKIQYILFTRNRNTFNAAATTIKAPDIEKNGRNELTCINENIYIGMMGSVPLGLIFDTEDDFMAKLEKSINQYFHSAKYLIFVGICFGIDPEKTMLADILISKSIVFASINEEVYDKKGKTTSPELRTRFCFNSSEVMGLQVAADGRKAKHMVVQIATGEHILDERYLREVSALTSEDIYGYEETCEKLLNLNIMKKNNTTKNIQVIVIGAVTGYIKNRTHQEWEFTASLAAFHYIDSKMHFQEISNHVSYDIKKPKSRRDDANLIPLYNQVELILVILDNEDFAAAITILSALNNKESDNDIFEIGCNVYIAMIGSHPVGLIVPSNKLMSSDYVVQAIIKYFPNTKYLVGGGGCSATDSSKFELGDVLISEKIICYVYNGKQYDIKIHEMTPEIKSIFCNLDDVESFKLPYGRRAKHFAVNISSGSNINNDMYIMKSSIDSPHISGFEEAGFHLTKVQSKMSRTGQRLHVIYIGGVFSYGESTEGDEWLFVASQAAFHYIASAIMKMN